MSLLDRRLLVVSGKGGVGKTTVAAAIALAAARRQRRTLVAEVAGQQRLQRLFDDVPQDLRRAEAALYPNLDALSIDPQRALEEYLLLQLKVRVIAERLIESRAFGYFAAAAPGLRELVTLGKIWHLTEQRAAAGGYRYELIVLDAPSTGHGVGLLHTPRAFLEIARAGRLHGEARELAALVSDRRRTGILLVTLAEEMPVNETIEALSRLREAGFDASAIVVNGLYPRRFSAPELKTISTTVPAGDVGRAAVRAALSAGARRREQASELRRLARAAHLPRVELPFVFRPEIDFEAVAELAAIVGPALETLE